jgi:YVTN family beta-propeller protein
MFRSRGPRLCAVLLASTLPACDNGGPTPPPPPPGSIARIEFPRDSFAVKQSHQLQLAARAYDANNQLIPGAALTYSVTGGAASITTGGLASAVKPGAVVVEAHAGNLSATATLEVFGHPEGVILGAEPLSGAPFSVAISRDGVIYVTRPTAASVARLDTSLVVEDTFPVGNEPTGITFAPDGQTAYVANQFSQDVGVIDVATNQQVASIPIPADPFVPFVSPDGSKVFITSNTSMVYIADAATRTLVDSVRVTHAPNGFALHPDMTRVYVSTFVGGTVSEIDLATDSIVRGWTPGGMPQDMVVTPDGSELFVANESGWVNVYDLGTGDAVDSIPLNGGGFGMALSPDQEHLYVSESNAGNVEVINIASRTIIHTIYVGAQPRRIAFTRHGGVAVVPNESGGYVSFLK